jgi:murein L,D-transpeptidase YafK
MAMIKRASSRLALALAAGLAVAACQGEVESTKHLQPIPSKTVALMESKGMRKDAPILVRIYKEESKLELWKKNESGRYALLKDYDICRWSGTLGPKVREGDKQAPEGFYAVAPGQMNPKSSYYLSFNLGYPNAFDRSYGRTGAHLMVHGDCLSAGCYAMTDEQIAEVYAIAREAFAGGQRSFQVQALPFRMTAENMARRRDDPNFAFWKNLKEGADHFEVTKLEPKVDVCERKYVFNAESGTGRFEPSAACPSYTVPFAVASAVAAKKRQDDQRFAELVGGGYQVAASYVPQNGRIRRTLDEPVVKVAAAPVAAPVRTASAVPAPAMAASASGPLPAPRPASLAARTQVAAAPKTSGGFAWLRGGSDETKAAEAAPRIAMPAEPVRTASVVPAAAPEQAVPLVAQPTPSAERPFYKRVLGLGGLVGGRIAPHTTAPSAMEAVPAPVPRPKGQRTADARL